MLKALQARSITFLHNTCIFMAGLVNAAYEYCQYEIKIKTCTCCCLKKDIQGEITPAVKRYARANNINMKEQ